jgi:hypothetical protein
MTLRWSTRSPVAVMGPRELYMRHCRAIVPFCDGPQM